MSLTHNKSSEIESWVQELVNWAEEYDIDEIMLITRITPYETLAQDLLSLSDLNLSHRPIEEFPTGLCQLRNIKRLHMAYMQLNTVPEFIMDLPNLEYLDLSHNRLHSLPEEMIKLKSLKTLDISWNRIDPKAEFISEIKNVNCAWNRK